MGSPSILRSSFNGADCRFCEQFTRLTYLIRLHEIITAEKKRIENPEEVRKRLRVP